MTREETLRRFKTWCQNNLGNHCSDEDAQMADNIMALLEQQPCIDAVSREAVEEITWEEPAYSDKYNVLTEVRDKVRELPPVQPVQQWHPVTEPPEKDIEVFVINTFWPKHRFIEKAKYVKNRGWYSIGIGDSEEIEEKYISHWMPVPKLPAPYETRK